MNHDGNDNDANGSNRNDNNVNGSNSDENNVNENSNNNSNNNNQHNSWASFSGQSARYSDATAANNAAQSPIRPPINIPAVDASEEAGAFGGGNDLVNSIIQSVWAVTDVDRISPADSPVERQNISPIHNPHSNPGLEGAAALWQMDFSNWGPLHVVDVPPYPKCIPTLNGSPYDGGPPTSSPSPVGSSRGSPYSNSSPPQVVSGSSSPMMSGNSSPGMNGARRRSPVENLRNTAGSRSPDELLLNLHDINGASSSQSPENNYTGCRPARRYRNRDDSRLFDDANYAVYYPTSRSAESRSPNALSINHIVGEILSPISAMGNANRLSNSSASPNCNECTLDRVSENSSHFYANNTRANAMDRVDTNQNNLRIQEISSAMASNMAAPDLVPSAQNTPRSNQLVLPAPNQLPRPATNQLGRPAPNQLGRPAPNHPGRPAPNQLGRPAPNQRARNNRQLNNRANQQQQPMGYQIPGQLALPAPAEDGPLVAPGPFFFLNRRVLSNREMDYCSGHSILQRHYCQTCLRLFCSVCGRESHVGHVSVTIREATKIAQQHLEQVIDECRFGVSVIREDINRTMDSSQTLDAKAAEAVQAVRDMTLQLTEALKLRERQLIDIIDTARRNKQQALDARAEGLRTGLVRLNQIIERLNRMDTPTLSSNPFNLNSTNDEASAQMYQVKALRNALPPLEEHYFKVDFTVPNIIEMLRNLGKINTGNGHVGDPLVVARAAMASMTPPVPPPVGRSIPSADFTVSLEHTRIASNSGSHLEIRSSTMCIGGDCTLEESLCRPWGVACDRNGHIVIADRSNDRIQIFRQNGTFVRRFGGEGNGRCQFSRPAGIAVDARGRIIVADKDNHRIQIVTMEGEFILAFGERGSAPGLFTYPWDVATNDACQIVVSDTRNHRIQLFSPEGVFLRKFGFEAQPQMWKCFDSPRGVVFDNDGNVLVTDFNNHRIVVVDADFMNARWLGCKNMAPNPVPPRTITRPQGIIIDDDGHIIVSDSRNNRVQILNKNGDCIWRFGSPGSGPGQFDRPSGLAITPKGKICVVDFGNHRMLMF